jgi:molybdopterin converting factor small subunit
MDNKRQKREGGHYERGRKEEDLNAIAERAVIKALEKKAAKKKKKAQLKKESEDEFCDAVENLSLSSSDESSDSE